MARRRLYKPERAPARPVGHGCDAPISLPDASIDEVKSAVWSAAFSAGFVVGRGVGYDPIRDEYTCIGKSLASGKAQDVTLSGADIAALIRLGRIATGGRHSSGEPLAH